MERLQEIKERLHKATPGPWRWDASTKHKTVSLETRGRGQHIVMGFVRWGLQEACPEFTEPLPEGNHTLNFKAARLAVRADKWMEERKSHHTGWDMDINHPDAQLIAHAPEDIKILIEEIERLTVERDNYKNAYESKIECEKYVEYDDDY